MYISRYLFTAINAIAEDVRWSIKVNPTKNDIFNEANVEKTWLFCVDMVIQIY